MSFIIINVCLMYTNIILSMICYRHKLNIINKTSPLREFHDPYYVFSWAQIEWIQLEGNPTVDSYYLKYSNNKQTNSHKLVLYLKETSCYCNELSRTKEFPMTTKTPSPPPFPSPRLQIHGEFANGI